MAICRQWHVVSEPTGMVEPGNFALVERDLPDLAEGEVRVRNLFLSVEPAMRSMMYNVADYPMGLEFNAPLWGRAVGLVEQSRSDDLAEGDLVFHYQGWRDVAQGPAAGFEKLPVEPGDKPEMFLSALGMPGVTAYFGLTEVGLPVAGETIFVSAAAGSVGSTVVQIAKALGLRVIGSAGGPAKCDLVRSLGADVAIDYRQGDLQQQLRQAAPEGLNIYFDNVGADHLDAALGNAATHARFVACGMIDTYNLKTHDQKVCFGNMMMIIAKQITLRGFIVNAFEHRIGECRARMREWLADGSIRPLMTIDEGLENTPKTFIGLFEGRNTGKALVRV
ncbi:MAG: NADP-dependent oxidoreductase [Novosphingobium sp.]|nr:NADP-dependent oxidoreductase [Novosphingobium sp.]